MCTTSSVIWVSFFRVSPCRRRRRHSFEECVVVVVDQRRHDKNAWGQCVVNEDNASSCRRRNDMNGSGMSDGRMNANSEFARCAAPSLAVFPIPLVFAGGLWYAKKLHNLCTNYCAKLIKYLNSIMRSKKCGFVHYSTCTTRWSWTLKNFLKFT